MIGVLEPYAGSLGFEKLKLSAGTDASDTAAAGDAARYDVTDAVLGAGAFATVRVAVDRATARQVAVKSIAKARLAGVDASFADVRREAQALAHVRGHAGVVSLLDVYEDAEHVHLVTELCGGGCVLERVLEGGRPCTEPEAASIVRQLLEALAYCHDLGVVHRDVKLDNMMLAPVADGDAASSNGAFKGHKLKLVDFGFAAFCRPRQLLSGLAGTPAYVAPDILRGSYDARVDVWSAGVVLYMLLSGQPPFSGVRTEAVFRQILDDGVPQMRAHPWPDVSAAAKDAVRRMMSWFPARRPTAREALGLEFFARAAPVPLPPLPSLPLLRIPPRESTHGAAASQPSSSSSNRARNGNSGDGPLPAAVHLPAALAAPYASTRQQPELLRRLRRFAALPPLRRAAARAVAGALPFDHLYGLKEQFDAAADADGGCEVTPAGLTAALGARCGSDEGGAAFDAEDLARLLASVSADGRARMRWSDFRAAALHETRLADEPAARLAFAHFCSFNAGAAARLEPRAVSAGALAAALAASGEREAGAAAAAALAAAGEPSDGTLNFEVFAAAIGADVPPAPAVLSGEPASRASSAACLGSPQQPPQRTSSGSSSGSGGPASTAADSDDSDDVARGASVRSDGGE